MSQPEAPEGSIFRQPGFARLWGAHTLGQLGERVHQLGLMWWTMATTGSVAWTGAMLVATTLPTVFLGPVAGTLADRFERRSLMLSSLVLRALVVGVLAGLAWQDTLSIPIALIGSALLAALTTLFSPAALAALPRVVGPAHVLRGTSLMESSMQGSALVGPVLGGLLVAAVGTGGAFAVNAFSLLVAALCLLGLPLSGRADAGAREGFFQAIGGGFRLLRRDPTVAGVLGCFAAVNIFTMPVILFLPYFAKEVFAVGAKGLGYMEASLGLGMLLAALVFASRGQVSRPFPIVSGGIAGVGLAIGWMGLQPVYSVHLLALALAGLCMGSVNVVTIAWFQTRVPPAEAGRFFGLMTSIASGLIPMSYGVFSLLAHSVAPAQLLLGNAFGVGLLALALAGVPGFRAARAQEPPQAA